ncbi:MAG: hypothetical protein JRG91_04900, partial [Deltaproteobacteria bacterium]|nr:hypothetical protein [Deltaproteobacteria bacterium]
LDGWESETWEIKLEVGEHTIEVNAPGHPPHKQKIELPGGQEIIVEVDLAAPQKEPAGPKPEEPKGERKKLPAAAFWSMAGLTAVLGISAAITGGLALKQKDKYSGLSYDDGWESEREKGMKLALTTDILLGIAGAAAVSTLVMAFFTDFEKEGTYDFSLLFSPSPDSLTLSLGGVF